jgi:hypothetical protein
MPSAAIHDIFTALIFGFKSPKTNHLMDQAANEATIQYRNGKLVLVPPMGPSTHRQYGHDPVFGTVAALVTGEDPRAGLAHLLIDSMFDGLEAAARDIMKHAGGKPSRSRKK